MMNMKKILILLTAVAVLLAACKKDDAPFVEITPPSLELLHDGGTITVQVHSNAQWTFMGDGQSWYTPSPVTGEGDGVVVITVEPYTEAAARAAAFRISTFGAVAEGTIVQAAPIPPASVSENQLDVIPAGGEYEVELPAGYTFTAESSADWVTVSGTDTEGHLVLTCDANKTKAKRTATVTARLTDGTVLATIEVVQNWRSLEPGEMLLEEIYFTGTLVPGSDDTSYRDKYFKITNNTDHLLFADRLAIVLSSYSSQTSDKGAWWEPQPLDDAIGVSSVYLIPGKGTDVPVQSGASLIIAIDPQDYSADGGVGIDLSKADFEYNDVNELSPDTDDPDIPDMLCWVKGSNSRTSLHNRGFQSYALVLFPDELTVNQFISDYKWIGKEDFWFKGTIFRTRDILPGNYAIPNEYVIDAVNCGIPEYFRTPAFNEGVDAGYTGAGTVYSDPNRFGKCPRRKRVNGKLVDTNNSTNDFDRDAKPSLAK